MALVEIQKLSMRFGGVTAVREFDLRVDAGRIFSIIGPNGAGKTTVFNALTGIYQPTAGTILFEGRRLQRPFSWKVALVCAMVGLATSLAAMLLAVNVDGLWRASIRRNYYVEDPANLDEMQMHFDRPKAWRDFWAYLDGRLAIERRSPTDWRVIAATGVELPGISGKASQAEADRLRDQLQRLIDSPSAARPVKIGSGWGIMAEGGREVLVQNQQRGPLDELVQKLGDVRRAQLDRRLIVGLALLGGLAFGSVGTLVVWLRARRTPDVVARAGVTRTFQNIRLFSNMTVLENVLVGLDRRQSRNPFRMALRTPGLRREEAAMRHLACDALRFVGLEAKRNTLAGNLAYGDQRRLEIARALATEPKLLLLDEPAAGMNPSETQTLVELIRSIRDSRITVLLIEHHMNLVMDISDRIAVLDHGEKIAEGAPGAVRKDPKVVEAYLGQESTP